MSTSEKEVAFNRNTWLTEIMATKIARKAKSAPAAAAELADALTSAIGTDGSASLTIEERTITVPADLAAALVELLEDISEGRDVTSAPAGLPLGTEVASDLLGVSRPWLTTLLDRGDIPSSRVGSKRRIRLGDLLAYRRCDDTRRREGLTWEFLEDE
jgi:excisionase family DNA binding protein